MGFTINENAIIAPKVLITILIDLSASMSEVIAGERITRLMVIEDVMKTFLATPNSDKYIEGRSLLEIGNLKIVGEIAIGVFNSLYPETVMWLKLADNNKGAPYYKLSEYKDGAVIGDLKPDGQTPLAEAVNKALATIDNRRTQLKAEDLSTKRPILFVITDGKQVPENNALLKEVKEEIITREDKKRILAFGISVFDEDAKDIAKIMREDATHILGKNTKIEDLVRILSMSVGQGVGSTDRNSAEEEHSSIKKRIEADKNFNDKIHLNSGKGKGIFDNLFSNE